MKTQNIDYNSLIDECILNIIYYTRTMNQQKSTILGEFFAEVCNKKINKYTKILLYLTKRDLVNKVNKSRIFKTENLIFKNYDYEKN